MANLAIFTSGNGSNFQKIVENVRKTKHKVVCMVCDKKDAYSFDRAKNLGIKSFFVDYKNRKREDVELEIISILDSYDVDLIALAGFMKLLTPVFLDKYKNRVINIHPALLPKHPGIHGIEDSYNSSDSKVGITIHYVDYGMDTGKIIKQDGFEIDRDVQSLEEVETLIHQLEYRNYSETIIKLLEEI